ncbi:MAG: histidinol-phosphatase HisJ family protein [Clostridia bacterium]|nr:histidinol-phosphatase HisJ family protein [Clostridia bacterium]
MILTDVHTHSAFSADGISPLADMAKTAKSRGIRYYGVSEHFDYDYLLQGILASGKPVRMTDAEAYFAEARRLQRELSDDRFRLLAGGEYGFADDTRCHEKYARLTETFRPDFVVNSVHTCEGDDCYFREYFTGKEKDYAYRAYLEAVRKSLEAPYPYDIVAHLGYVSRNAPYADGKLRYDEYHEPIDDILKQVILKDKILEINSSSAGSGSGFLPDTDILTRYFELGGRLVSFASDAHGVSRIAEKRELVCSALKRIGFTAITVPDCGERISVEL